MTAAHVTLGRAVRRCACQRSGVAMVEFALSLPLVLALGCYGIEVVNLALVNLRMNQIALNLADNASRVGSMQSNNTTQLREIDVNDALTAARLQGQTWQITRRGRITLSSLEEHDGKQYIHWQRCLGEKSGQGFDSRYGTTRVTDGTQSGASYAGTVVTGGMGASNSKVAAPPDSGVMFVDLTYDYAPIVGYLWLPSRIMRLHYEASFIVRDRRTFDQIYNPQPAATRYTCDRYTAT